MYGGTGVSRGVRRTTWERSLKNWELQIPCFEEFLGGENVLGLVPASLPHALGYACTFYPPTSPPPTLSRPIKLIIKALARSSPGRVRDTIRTFLVERDWWIQTHWDWNPVDLV